ncbi:MAG: pseudouridine-5'-phosphate glycosidase [Paracoccaceae bacterium]|jgi:pseudouridine-5'-phosphate glycosidase|nr:pseudouridine-5'-phosphate glycosidase [Paracoccaceae bacterium]
MKSIKFSTEVKKAISLNSPIVALESTIITHGMPYPKNLETAKIVEKTVRDNEATPATIAVINGTVHIGLETKQLETLSKVKTSEKLSRSDLAICLAKKQTGSTTVAATMILANFVGIKVFATGGIGGAHRGSETDFDISADLHELSKTAVNVVCAGPKAILDIPKTLEILETLGVPVITYRQDNLPGFWSKSLTIKSPSRMDSTAEIAEAFRIRQELGLSGGQLIANPIPSSEEIPWPEISKVINQSISECQELKIKGKEVTPFLLNRIFEITNGKSLEANKALIINNARLAAKIAVNLKNL